MKKIYVGVAILLTMIYLLLWPYNAIAQEIPSATLLDAEIISVTAIVKNQQTPAGSNLIRFRIQQGSLKGREFSSDFDTSRQTFGGYHKGDQVIISYSKHADGTEVVYVIDYNRKPQLLLLFCLFFMLVIAIGRWKGLYSFIGMVLSFIVIGRMIIPNIMMGNDPIIVSLLGSIFIIPLTFYLAHGIHKKTTVAVVGTFLALAVTAALAYASIEFTRLTGFAAEEATYLQALKGATINIKNLLLAGIIIGALGVLDDITISQTSIVEELARANPKYTFKQLYASAMTVGRDHIASLVNTLVLVYAGASLPLFLLFYNTQYSYAQVISQEVIASEIVRTLVSSIGIISAVPITTLLACMYITKNLRK